MPRKKFNGHRFSSIIMLSALISASGVAADSIQNCLRPPDDQIISNILNYYVSSRPETVAVSSDDGYISLPLKQYSSSVEFLNVHPNCCEVLDTGPEGLMPEPVVVENIDLAGSVRISHDLEYFIDSTLISKSVTDTYIAFDSCGSAINFSFDFNVF